MNRIVFLGGPYDGLERIVQSAPPSTFYSPFARIDAMATFPIKEEHIYSGVECFKYELRGQEYHYLGIEKF